MEGFGSRVDFQAEGAVDGDAGVSATEVVDRLGAGESWDRLARSTGLTLRDILAVVTVVALGPEDSPGPPLIRSRPPRPSLLPALSEPALASAGLQGDRGARLALAAGLLQIHDFWDASHEAAQAADDLGERETSAYWHAIGHRREPDAANAAYWFRRVGRHPIFEPLHRAATNLIRGEAFGKVDPRLGRAAAWEPSTLVDLTNLAAPGSPAEGLARRLQRTEMRLLVQASAAAAGLV